MKLKTQFYHLNLCLYESDLKVKNQYFNKNKSLIMHDPHTLLDFYLYQSRIHKRYGFKPIKYINYYIETF